MEEQTRPIARIVEPLNVVEGAGVCLRRTIGSHALEVWGIDFSIPAFLCNRRYSLAIQFSCALYRSPKCPI